MTMKPRFLIPLFALALASFTSAQEAGESTSSDALESFVQALQELQADPEALESALDEARRRLAGRPSAAPADRAELKERAAALQEQAAAIAKQLESIRTQMAALQKHIDDADPARAETER